MARGAGLRYIGPHANGSKELGLTETPLKFLLVGDADVGKSEFFTGLPEVDAANFDGDLPQAALPRLATVLLDGHAINVQLWDTSGQGRFSTIIRRYSRGAHGILLVYDITNRWSFGGMKRWLREVDEFVPGIPRILVGNRLHREFDRAVSRKDAEAFASKRRMEYFEVSTLAHFNVDECLTQVARMAVQRAALHRPSHRRRNPESLESLACRTIVKNIKSIHLIEKLRLPPMLHHQVRSFAQGSQVASAVLPLSQRAPKGAMAIAPRFVRRAYNSCRQKIRRWINHVE
ncbi:hypothetical protein PRIPAC_95485 [Pristionchus pacificus]|uniref:SOCS box domain-containing protein n=1 Tax=Pristionchus pacificus TaxID=54126 RepID=A0A2A6BJI6_PRIPA|nr:hypothetical protein PRIPAC_95485 [Pristionchus pacificus]|eukprot:PDM65998.1 hypothetical protein PRIPAC_44092 [Pristionchus pacificus]